MQPADEPPPHVLKEPLIPEGVAEELPALLEELRDRWLDLKWRRSGSGQSARGVGRLKLHIATRLVLEDLDHCFKLATDRGQQLSAKRWESVLEDLRNLRLKLDAQS
jgi:hypothetical protein